MKRFTALILAMLLLTGIFPVVPASGAEVGAKAESSLSKPAPEVQNKPLLGKDSLEKVISLVKSRLDIPAVYTEFSSDVYDNGGKTMFRLRWSNSSYYFSSVNGSIEVTVDENGIVNNYYSYSYDRNYDYNRRLPSITAIQAAERAQRFLTGMCPDIAAEVSFDKAAYRCSIEYDGSYSFYFYRQANGIPFYDNSIHIQVNGQTGVVSSMNRNWDGSLVFPKTDKVISMGKANDAYKKEIGLRLRYRLISGQNGLKSTLQYSPTAVDMLYAIDAVTGDKLAVNTIYNPYNDYVYRPDTSYSMPVSDSELNEIRQLKSLMDEKEGEKLARSMTELGIDSAYRLNRYSYNRTAGSGYTLQLEFIKPSAMEDIGKDIPPEKLKVMMAAGMGGGYANIAFDAATSELISLNASVDSTGAVVSKALARAELQKTAEAFLGKYKSARFKQVELSESTPYVNDYMMKFGMAGPENSGSLVYNRKVNGITVEGNSMNLSLDTATGRITSYSEVWDDMAFAPANGIISLDKAYDVLFGQNGFELKYAAVVAPSADQNGVSVSTGKPVSPEVKLVYSPENNKPVVIDALKGVLVNGGTGEEYIDKNTISYHDLDGNPHKAEVESLAKSGLLPLEKSFRPDTAMLQKDYLCILFQLRGNSLPGMSSGEMTQTAQDGMYRQLISDGILTDEERAPDAALTKEQAVKFLLKAVGYGKFAEMKGIFDCSFTDKAEIEPGLLGYAAIAGSLGIVEGQSFEPGKELTRVEAVMMIYRYVKR